MSATRTRSHFVSVGVLAKQIGLTRAELDMTEYAAAGGLHRLQGFRDVLRSRQAKAEMSDTALSPGSGGCALEYENVAGSGRLCLNEIGFRIDRLHAQDCAIEGISPRGVANANSQVRQAVRLYHRSCR